MARSSYDNFGGRKLTIHDKILLRNQENARRAAEFAAKREAADAARAEQAEAEQALADLAPTDEQLAEIEAEGSDAVVLVDEKPLRLTTDPPKATVTVDEPVRRDDGLVECHVCGKTYKTDRGLEGHIAKEHP